MEAVSYLARSRSRFRGLRKSIGGHAKTKVWGCQTNTTFKSTSVGWSSSSLSIYAVIRGQNRELPGKCDLARCAARRLTRLRPRHADALDLLRCPMVRRTRKKWQRWSLNAARGKCHEMLKSSLQSRHWPRRSPAWVVRQAALLFKGMPQHLRGPAAENIATRMERHDYVEWLFLQPVENPRSQSRPAKRWEICYSTRSDARRDLVYLGGGRADFLTTRR